MLPKIIVVKLETNRNYNQWIAYLNERGNVNPKYSVGNSKEEALGKFILENLYVVKNYVEVQK